MSKTVQQLLILTGHFQKMAVDVSQPPEFENDYKIWQKMKDPNFKEETIPKKEDQEKKRLEQEKKLEEEISRKWLEEHRRILDEVRPEDDLTPLLGKNASIERLLNKYAQGAPTGYYNPTEQTEADAASFMQPGGESHVRGGPGKPQYAPARQQRPASDPQVKLVQQTLNKMRLTGADGKPLVEDGIRGRNTNFALQSYKTEYQMPQATDAIAMNSILHPQARPNQGYAEGRPPTNNNTNQTQVAQQQPAKPATNRWI